MNCKSRIAGSVLGLFAMSFTTSAMSQVQNGGFENGLTGWDTSGSVEVLGSSNLSPPVGPFEGDSFALLSSGPGSNGGGNSGADIDSSGANEFDVAKLSQTFYASEPGYLRFVVAGFATAEIIAPLDVDDIFQVSIDGNPVVQGSVPGIAGSGSFADFGVLDGVAYTVNSPGVTNGSSFLDGVTGLQEFIFDLPAGVHTIEFLVADEQDTGFDSGLFVDGVAFVEVENIPTLSMWNLLLLVMLIALAGKIHFRRQVRTA